MGTIVYGTSDDLIEIEGDVHGEVGSFGTDDKDQGVLLIFSDGTILEVKYGKGDMAIWGINLIVRGVCFTKIEPCANEDAALYSDIAHFEGGRLSWVYAAKEWERVK